MSLKKKSGNNKGEDFVMDKEEINYEVNEVEDMEDESDIDEEVEESDNDLMDYADVDTMEKMTFDFEAFPPDPSDQEGILDLVTQASFIFDTILFVDKLNIINKIS